MWCSAHHHIVWLWTHSAYFCELRGVLWSHVHQRSWTGIAYLVNLHTRTCGTVNPSLVQHTQSTEANSENKQRTCTEYIYIVHTEFIHRVVIHSTYTTCKHRQKYQTEKHTQFTHTVHTHSSHTQCTHTVHTHSAHTQCTHTVHTHSAHTQI